MSRRIAAKPGSDEGHRRILDAARGAFATVGFEGASLRTISAEAGVLHTAMLYHFNTKDVLWRAVMTELFEDLTGRFARRTAELRSAAPERLARALVRDFVHFCAERPELHRIMTIEGRANTDRLKWIVESHTRTLFENVIPMVSLASPAAAAGDPIRLYYAIVGVAASTFSLAPEFKQLSGRDPFRPKEIEATAAWVEGMIFGVKRSK
ncbi:MAG: helix-turn-helix domain-containing protein [Alphaproteobacteria bacterium]|nr:helix-turn-helix domain-containing protein [Alphaproteobacteria bacterium]